MIGLIVRPTSTHTYMYRYIFVENFGENEKNKDSTKAHVALARHEKHQGYSSYIVHE
jgi:hypothetical protein